MNPKMKKNETINYFRRSRIHWLFMLNILNAYYEKEIITKSDLIHKIQVSHITILMFWKILLISTSTKLLYFCSLLKFKIVLLNLIPTIFSGLNISKFNFKITFTSSN